jgi:16S rRNA (guanine(966)-N(2))-methyltransferase RsmD
MRVIAGIARGRTLLAPKDMGTRPMMDVVKGSLFNMLESLGGIEDANVLDLFAGSGSLGIEALSRGAAHADFVEQSREACKVIDENLARLGFASQGRVIARSVGQFITIPLAPTEREEGKAYDVVFMDAPYPAQVSQELLTRLAGWPRLGDNALVCIGHHKREVLPDQLAYLERIKHRCFGASCISIYRNRKTET